MGGGRVCPGSESGPRASFLGHPADQVNNHPEATTQRLQTQMPMAFETGGSLLAGGCIVSPRTILFTIERQDNTMAMSRGFGVKSGFKSWFCHLPTLNF